MRWLIIILLFPFSSETQVQYQSDVRTSKKIVDTSAVRINQSHSKVLAIFQSIEYGIRTSKVEEFDKELGSIVSITIGVSERGYFSMNQAASVLSGYFSGRRAISFEFSRIHEKGTAPYATGRLVYAQKGNQESVQVYVSLTKKGPRWVISQFNIY